MTNSAKVIYQFFSGFGIPAYDEQSVPDDATYPYITYQNIEGRWDTPTSISASVWYAGTSFTEIFKKVDEIKKKIGEGLRIPVEGGGCVWIYADSPFSQVQDSGADNVKSVYLMIFAHDLCA